MPKSVFTKILRILQATVKQTCLLLVLIPSTLHLGWVPLLDLHLGRTSSLIFNTTQKIFFLGGTAFFQVFDYTSHEKLCRKIFAGGVGGGSMMEFRKVCSSRFTTHACMVSIVTKR